MHHFRDIIIPTGHWLGAYIISVANSILLLWLWQGRKNDSRVERVGGDIRRQRKMKEGIEVSA